MTFKKVYILIVSTLFISKIFGQTESLYIPVTINAPLFNNIINNEQQVATLINNYGIQLHYARQSKQFILIAGIQQNNGNLKFDPLNFNKYRDQDQETQLIQSYPTKMFYSELGMGYNFKLKSQKLTMMAGLGYQFHNYNTRYFIQFDWGNEHKIINAGVSFRGNYTFIKGCDFFTLEPVVQGKIKIWKFRIVNQFGYSIALKKDHDYMKPILSVGLEFVM
jgi:hypothetical protein